MINIALGTTFTLVILKLLGLLDFSWLVIILPLLIIIYASILMLLELVMQIAFTKEEKIELLNSLKEKVDEIFKRKANRRKLNKW